MTPEKLERLLAGDDEHSSASAIEKWRDCHRKWAWRYVGGVKDPPNIYASAGLEVHAASKNWLTEGKLPAVGSELYKVFATMVPHMPAPGTCTEVDDVRFEIVTEAGIIVGFIDAEEAPSDATGGLPVVHDWKTTSDLRYHKPAEVLDPQRVIYGVRTLERWGVDEAELHWLYVLRGVDKATGAIIAPKRPKALPIRRRVSLSVLDKPWEDVLRDVENTGAARRSGKSPLDYDYDARVCDKYGGCPYVKNCNLTPTERLRSHMSALSLKDRMKAHGSAAAAAPTPAPAVATTSAALGAAAPSPTVSAATASLAARIGTKPPGPVNPPEAALPPAPTAAPKPQQSTMAKLFGMGKKAEHTPAPQAAPEPAQAPTAPVPVADVEVSFAGEKLAPPAPLERLTVPAAAPTPTPVAAPYGGGFALFIDCAPIKTDRGGLVNFAALIEPVLEQLQLRTGVAHYRLMPDTFGSAPAIFASELDAYLYDKPLPANLGVAMSLSSMEARDGLEVMMKHAGLVVRGM